MLEQKLEKLFVEKFEEVFTAKGLDIQVIGTLQDTMYGKAEETSANGVLIVKMAPREYELPTTPTAKMSGTLSLSLRADVDYNGKTYIDVCGIILDELERLQKCLDDVHDDYAVEGEWEPTGFLVGQGDTSIDQVNKVWGYTHGFTMYGIILK